MSRRMILLAALLAPAVAHAQDAPAPAPGDTGETLTIKDGSHPEDMGEQGIGATLGVATGGRSTPGGLRITGHYLYQLTDEDWFDGTASFTFGGGGAECFRDRMDTFLCEHGLADGNALEIAANVRRFMRGNDKFWPFIQVGIGLSYVRFGDDDVSGVAIPLHGGGGLRVSVAPEVAITASATVDVGVARFNHSLGAEPQLGLTIAAGAEFRL